MKKIYFSFAAAFLAAAFAPTNALADEWYMEGAFNYWDKTFFEEKENGEFEVYVQKFTGDFFICNSTGTTAYGGSEYLKLDEVYNLVKDGNNLYFPEEISYVEDAFITFNPTDETLLITGTAMQEQTISQTAYVAGTFNNWNMTDPNAMLMLEAGTQIYSGRVDMSAKEGEQIVEWRIYTSEENPENFVWGNTSLSDGDVREGFLMEGSSTAVTTAPGTYQFWFNSANGMFRLTPVTNSDEKSVTISPSTDEVRNRYSEFILTFNGYNTATLDPAMYDIYNGPGTFTNVETGEVVARIGGQPMPRINNESVLQLSQTIFNQEYLDKEGNPGDDEKDKYKPYADGAYMLTIPAGSIMLNDGQTTVPNEKIDFLFTLGNVHGGSGLTGIADVYQNMDIYTLNGTLVVKQATADDINALPKGVYVAKGNKFIVK